MTATRHIPLDVAGPTVRDVMLVEARTIAPDTPTLEPGDGIERALQLLEHSSRVPVVDADGRLHGLVCLNRGKSAFCASPTR